MTNELEVEGQGVLIYCTKAEHPLRFLHVHAVTVSNKANLTTIRAEIEKN